MGKSLYDRISEDNIRKYGTEYEKVLRIIINQYSDRTHFIYEILQNAEDAGATHIKFQLEKTSSLSSITAGPLMRKTSKESAVLQAERRKTAPELVILASALSLSIAIRTDLRSILQNTILL